MKKNVLVTGGSGYVGGNLINLLCALPYGVKAILRENASTELFDKDKVKIYRGNFYDENLLQSALKNVDVVIHCAGLVDPTNSKKEEMMQINYQATKTLLNQCIKSGVSKFIYISSANVLTICQDNFKDGKFLPCSKFNLNNAQDYYTKSKAMATEYVLHCANKKYIDALAICPTSIIGPNFSRPTATHQMIEMYLNNSLRVTLDGGYNFVDIRTVIHAIASAIEKGKSGEVYIIGEEYVPLSKMFEKLSSLSNIKQPKFKVPTFLALFGLKLYELFNKNNLNPLLSTSGLKTVLKKADFDTSNSEQDFSIKHISVDKSLKDTIDFIKSTKKEGYATLKEKF